MGEIREFKAKEVNTKPKKVYVPIPQPEVYYGVTVTKETVLEFENAHLKQRLQDLVLHTEYTLKDKNFISEVKTDLFLSENELLLLEEDGRGYFKPQNVKMGTIDEAIEEMNFIKNEISKIKE